MLHCLEECIGKRENYNAMDKRITSPTNESRRRQLPAIRCQPEGQLSFSSGLFSNQTITVSKVWHYIMDTFSGEFLNLPLDNHRLKGYMYMYSTRTDLIPH